MINDDDSRSFSPTERDNGYEVVCTIYPQLITTKVIRKSEESELCGALASFLSVLKKAEMEIKCAKANEQELGDIV